MIRRGSTGSISGHLFRSEHAAQGNKVLKELATKVGRVEVVAAGITGLDQNNDRARILIASCFDIDEARVLIETDLAMAYRSAFAPGAGILLYAGTGSAAVHIDEQGRLHRAGGWGILIDDAGGGAWLGAAALRQVLHDVDRGLPFDNSILGFELAERLPGAKWKSIREYVYGGSRSEMAALAPAVAAAADRGDLGALSLLDQTIEALEHLAGRLLHRLGPLPVAFGGGMSALHPRVVEGLLGRLSNAACVELDAAAAAAEQARRLHHDRP